MKNDDGSAFPWKPLHFLVPRRGWKPGQFMGRASENYVRRLMLPGQLIYVTKNIHVDILPVGIEGYTAIIGKGYGPRGAVVCQPAASLPDVFLSAVFIHDGFNRR